MSEKTVYRAFREGVLRPGDRIERVENVLVDGMPDVNYCIEGTEGWIEIKNPTEPKRASTPLFGSNHRVSQSQKNWFMMQRQARGVCWFLIVTDIRWMLIDGRHHDEVNEMTVQELIDTSKFHMLKKEKQRRWDDLRNRLALGLREF